MVKEELWQKDNVLYGKDVEIKAGPCFQIKA